MPPLTSTHSKSKAQYLGGLLLCYVRRLDTICAQSAPGWIGHQEIISALRAHQPEAAREAVGRHINLFRDKMLRLIGA
ncbi:MAG: hypothetical protein ACLQVM_17000 [Terriglobia bacterium]